MKKMWWVLGGAAAVGVTVYMLKRDDVEHRVKKTARKLRRELEPMEERVSGRLENLADAISTISRKLRVATRLVDAALGRIAA
jgi:hypothetical protein